ncbi:hypothetical protein U5640_15900 [Streptomyces sp. SS7]|uniref:hypothetical protein n=1 Tax=Streptomyces sp. SS7 TaxID=3108485 RepID=UPI0030EB739B
MSERINTQNTYAEVSEGTARLEKVKVADIEGLTFWYGGKGSRKTRPNYSQRCRLANKAHNVIAIVQDVTGQELTTVRASSLIWAAEMAEAPEVDAPQAEESGEVAQDQEREELPEVAPAVESGEDQDQGEDVKADGKIWCGTDGNPLFFHAFPERNAACNRRYWPRRADGFVTLAEVETWEDARVCERCLNKVGQTPERADISEAPEVAEEVEVTAQDVADAALSSGECVWTDAQVSDAQGSSEAREAAAQRLDALRRGEAAEVATEAEFEGVHRNISFMITMAPNEKARDSWKRVSLASYWAHEIKAHAQANRANGWDVIADEWSDGELNVMMLECAPQSAEEAIAYARTTVVDPYRKREADALISAWGF